MYALKRRRSDVVLFFLESDMAAEGGKTTERNQDTREANRRPLYYEDDRSPADIEWDERQRRIRDSDLRDN